MKSRIFYSNVLKCFWMFLFVLVLGTTKSIAQDSQPCRFVGTDENGTVIYRSEITCDFPVLLGNGPADQVNFQTASDAWFINQAGEFAAFAYYYYEIGERQLSSQSPDRQMAILSNPDKFHIIPEPIGGE
jgi:hypothetical protein